MLRTLEFNCLHSGAAVGSNDAMAFAQAIRRVVMPTRRRGREAWVDALSAGMVLCGAAAGIFLLMGTPFMLYSTLPYEDVAAGPLAGDYAHLRVGLTAAPRFLDWFGASPHWSMGVMIGDHTGLADAVLRFNAWLGAAPKLYFAAGMLWGAVALAALVPAELPGWAARGALTASFVSDLARLALTAAVIIWAATQLLLGTQYLIAILVGAVVLIAVAYGIHEFRAARRTARRG